MSEQLPDYQPAALSGAYFRWVSKANGITVLVKGVGVAMHPFTEDPIVCVKYKTVDPLTLTPAPRPYFMELDSFIERHVIESFGFE